MLEADLEGLFEAKGEGLSLRLAVSITVPVPGKSRTPEGEDCTEGVLAFDSDSAPDLDCTPPVEVGGASDGVKYGEGVPTSVLEAVEQAVFPPSGEKDGATVMDTVTEIVEEWEKEGEALGGSVTEGIVEVEREVITEADPRKLALPAFESVPTPTTPPHDPVLSGMDKEGVDERVPSPKP